MTTTDPRGEGMPWMSPYLIVPDVDKAISFYECAFGFERGEAMTNEAGQTVHASMHHHGQVFMMGREGAWEREIRSPKTSGVRSPMNLYVYVDDVDAMYRRALECNAETCSEPGDMFWGDRVAAVYDPDGYGWSLATHIKAMQRSESLESQASDVAQ